MSIRKNQRGEPSTFVLLNIALDMSTYTINIISNERVFIPKYQKVIDRIAEEATSIYHLIRVANGIKVTDSNLADERLRLQDEAEVLCERLKSDIMIAHKLFHLRERRVVTWTKKVDNVETNLHSWHLSDKKRYS